MYKLQDRLMTEDVETCVSITKKTKIDKQIGFCLVLSCQHTFNNWNAGTNGEYSF